MGPLCSAATSFNGTGRGWLRGGEGRLRGGEGAVKGQRGGGEGWKVKCEPGAEGVHGKAPDCLGMLI